MAFNVRRSEVAAPSFTPAPYGLLAVAQTIDDPSGRWRNGVVYRSDVCNPAIQTTADCVTGTGATKTVTDPGWRGADPFAVYSYVSCGPLGLTETEGWKLAENSLVNNEAWQVENVFWSGGTPTIYPHLAANPEVTENDDTTQVVIQTAATTVTTGAVLLDPVEAVGALEGLLGDCYGGVGVLHVPAIAAAHLAHFGLIERRGQLYETPAGNRVAIGRGYPGTGPDGTRQDLVGGVAQAVWFYITGAVSYRRGPVTRLGNWRSAIDRSTNDMTLVVERVYLFDWDCCHYAAQVSLGGVVVGTPGAAT